METTPIQADKFSDVADAAMAQTDVVEANRDEMLRALREQRGQLMLALSGVKTAMSKLGEPVVEEPAEETAAKPGRKKPGPKPGSKRNKPGPKPKAGKVAAKAKPGPKPKAGKPGRKKDLSGVSIPEAILSLLGKNKMSAVDIMNGLKASGLSSAPTSTHPTLIRMVSKGKLKSTGERRNRVYFA